MAVVYVALGGAIGSVLRYLVALLAGHWWGTGLPYGTFAVNVVGSFAMGVLIAWLARTVPAHQQEIHVFAAVGIMGGFTTFSAFSLEMAGMIERGEMGTAVGYALLSVIVSVTALFAGMWTLRMVA